MRVVRGEKTKLSPVNIVQAKVEHSLLCLAVGQVTLNLTVTIHGEDFNWYQTLKRWAFSMVLAVCVLPVPVVAASLSIGGELAGTYVDAETINTVLSSIPVADRSMGYKSLAERLPQLGVKVISINVGPFTNDDVRLDPQHLKPGDVDYKFTMAPAPAPAAVSAICPLSGTFGLTKRGSKWLPQDRTSNFLINGYSKCAPPQ